MRREFPAAGVAHRAAHLSLNEARETGARTFWRFWAGERAQSRQCDRGGQTDQLITAAQQSAVYWAQQSAVYRAVDKHDQISALCRVTG